MGSDLYFLIDMLITAAGVYVVVQYLISLKTHTIQQNLLLPKDVDVKKCKNPEGYIRYIGPRQVIFGLAAVACGVMNLIQDATEWNSGLVSIGGTAVFLVATVWYAYGMRKAVSEYWGKK